MATTKKTGFVKKLSKNPKYAFLKKMTKQEIKDDKDRTAKPVGWRFKGEGNYKKPTKEEVKKGKQRGTVYYENRPNRSDVNPRIKLKKGGKVKAIQETQEEVYIDFLNKDKNFRQDRKNFNSYQEAETWARQNLGNFNPDMIKYVFEKGGKIPDNYKGKKPSYIWNSWGKKQRRHFIADHQELKPFLKKANDVSGKSWKNLPTFVEGVNIKNIIAIHVWSGQYAKGGNIPNEFKVGDKVRIPLTKGMGVKAEPNKQYAISNKQPYMVIEHIYYKDTPFEVYTLKAEGYKGGADHYSIKDLVPYKGSSKNTNTKYKAQTPIVAGVPQPVNTTNKEKALQLACVELSNRYGIEYSTVYAIAKAGQMYC